MTEIKEQILNLRHDECDEYCENPCLIERHVRHEAADTMEKLLAVVEAAREARTPDEYNLLSVEKGWKLDEALAALDEDDDRD